MKNNNILSYNLNGWCPVNKTISYKKKINRFAAYVRELYGEPMIIMLQEMLAGKDQQFLKQLKNEFSGYEVITPSFDYHQHYKSIMVVTLIRKDVLGNYTVKVLDDELPNRINYVIASIANVEYRILNVHCVQSMNFRNRAAWYIEDRTKKKKRMWQHLIDEANNHSDSNVIIAGDLQENKEGVHIKEIISKGYIMADTCQVTINNNFFSEDHIDHIIFSRGAYDELNPAVFVDDSKIGNLSDHALVYATCAL